MYHIYRHIQVQLSLQKLVRSLWALGIYQGKEDATLESAKTVEVCDDVSNAIRAFELLKQKNVITNNHISEDGTKLTFEEKSRLQIMVW